MALERNHWLSIEAPEGEIDDACEEVISFIQEKLEEEYEGEYGVAVDGPLDTFENSNGELVAEHKAIPIFATQKHSRSEGSEKP